MKAVYKRRLLEAAEIVEKVPKHLIDMGSINTNDCNSPACILGHYFFKYKKPLRDADGDMFDAADDHFGLEFYETYELFGSSGCNHAKTGEQAAKYIRNFVKRKYG